MATLGSSPDELVDALQAALAARPDAPEAALFLAQVLVDRGRAEDLPEAERLASSAIFSVQVPQLQAMGHATLAQIYEATGRSTAAVEVVLKRLGHAAIRHGDERPPGRTLPHCLRKRVVVGPGDRVRAHTPDSAEITP